MISSGFVCASEDSEMISSVSDFFNQVCAFQTCLLLSRYIQLWKSQAGETYMKWRLITFV